MTEGGPEYRFSLVGESSSIHYQLDRTTLEFGQQAYSAVFAKELYVLNTGKVPFSFVVGTDDVTLAGRVTVSPIGGTVNGGERQKITVKFCPRVPERVRETFTVQVAYFEREVVTVTGEGLFPHCTFSLPRHNEQGINLKKN